MDSLLEKRIALLVGKGGVGRSTLTAALARLAARSGKRVLIAEIAETSDPTERERSYSPLARIYGRNHLPEAPVELEKGIWGSLLVPRRGHELFLASVIKTETLARAALQSEALRRLTEAAPSFREMGVFYHLLTYLRETLPDGRLRFDWIALDMPATGHALAMTGLPEVFLKIFSSGPLVRALEEGQSYLYDSAQTGTYVVSLPEPLPVTESLELIDGLKKTRMPVAGVILNRMPKDPFNPDERRGLKQILTPELEERVLGVSGFLRFEDCTRSVERLKKECAVPFIQIPEISGTLTQSERVDRIVSILEKGKSHAASREAPLAMG